MPKDNRTDANALLAQYPALAHIVTHLTFETGAEVLTAIDRRSDSPEKFARFRAIEFFALGVYETAYEQIYGSPCEHEVHLWWAAEANGRSREVWRRLNGDRGPYFIDSDEAYEGIVSFASMPVNTDPAVLSDFVKDTELMGILGVEARWTPPVKQIDPDPDLESTDKGVDL